MDGAVPQVFSAMVMSFAHGSNDVANAMGPFSAVYAIWENKNVPTKSAVCLTQGCGVTLPLRLC